jgi:FG-GAP-like repeat/FG-GAP repeat
VSLDATRIVSIGRGVLLCLLASGCAEPEGSVGERSPSPWVDASACTRQDLLPLPDDDGGACAPLVIPLESPVDAAAVTCVPGRSQSCTCAPSRAGFRSCDGYGQWGVCLCQDIPAIVDETAGVFVHGDAIVLPPRLLSPISGHRVMSQRPTLRWALPEGLRRARVELCEDRPCAHLLSRTEVNGDSWRPNEPLRPGVVFWRVFGLDDRGGEVWTSASWEFGVRHRDTPADIVGGPIKDFNGDGYDETVVETVQGTALLLGGVGGIRPTPQFIGTSVGWTTAGDVNGDGLADLVTSRFGTLDVGWSGRDVLDGDGVVRQFFGSVRCSLSYGGRILQPAYREGYGFGETLAIGDFNGDGFGDLVASMSRSIVLVLGGEGGLDAASARVVWLDQSYSTLNLGPELASVGDVDRDGYEDFALGNYGVSDGDGIVRIFYGNPSARPGARVQTVVAPYGGEFGRALIGGDFTGDGYSDLVVGAWNSFYVYAGGRSGLRLFQERRTSEAVAGHSPITPFFGAPGDLDGDGLLDLIALRSMVYRSFGAAGFLDAPQMRLTSESMTSPGDVDGDGVDDLVTSGLGNDRIGVDLFLGGPTICAPTRSWRDVGLPLQIAHE